MPIQLTTSPYELDDNNELVVPPETRRAYFMEKIREIDAEIEKWQARGKPVDNFRAYRTAYELDLQRAIDELHDLVKEHGPAVPTTGAEDDGMEVDITGEDVPVDSSPQPRVLPTRQAHQRVFLGQMPWDFSEEQGGRNSKALTIRIPARPRKKVEPSTSGMSQMQAESMRKTALPAAPPSPTPVVAPIWLPHRGFDEATLSITRELQAQSRLTVTADPIRDRNSVAGETKVPSFKFGKPLLLSDPDSPLPLPSPLLAPVVIEPEPNPTPRPTPTRSQLLIEKYLPGLSSTPARIVTETFAPASTQPVFTTLSSQTKPKTRLRAPTVPSTAFVSDYEAYSPPTRPQARAPILSHQVASSSSQKHIALPAPSSPQDTLEPVTPTRKKTKEVRDLPKLFGMKSGFPWLQYVPQLFTIPTRKDLGPAGKLKCLTCITKCLGPCEHRRAKDTAQLKSVSHTHHLLEGVMKCEPCRKGKAAHCSHQKSTALWQLWSEQLRPPTLASNTHLQSRLRSLTASWNIVEGAKNTYEAALQKYQHDVVEFATELAQAEDYFSFNPSYWVDSSLVPNLAAQEAVFAAVHKALGDEPDAKLQDAANDLFLAHQTFASNLAARYGAEKPVDFAQPTTLSYESRHKSATSAASAAVFRGQGQKKENGKFRD
ncbi:hypothetical protein NP233_g5336 [Leucocoprinus birnbaumii]|uniref:Uncharacterized protein n=1 Tax=Leucocoprinus birnbaumii TaxID=56174 RepID=A0AAD5VZC1_9AGAR|nr:hypothetical protein NP233_g5336 [Leucocoprinus birnbaumii]